MLHGFATFLLTHVTPWKGWWAGVHWLGGKTPVRATPVLGICFWPGQPADSGAGRNEGQVVSMGTDMVSYMVITWCPAM